MSRILRVISTAVIGVGLVLLFLYLCLFENTGKELALTENMDLPALEPVRQAAGTVRRAPGSCTFLGL